MDCLYIIGNGFDLAHGLKTSYCCFRRYLEKYQESFLIKLEEMYDFPSLLVEEYCWTEQQRKKALKEREELVLSSLWGSIEEKLSFANEDEMISASIAAVNSLNLESGPIVIESTLNAHWKAQYMEQAHRYEVEHMELKDKSRKAQEELKQLESAQTGRDRFVGAIRRFLEMQTLTPALLRELIDHIDVYETEGKGKNRTQRIVIHYRFVDVIDLPEQVQSENLKLDLRQGVAVEYVPSPVSA